MYADVIGHVVEKDTMRETEKKKEGRAGSLT